jgi:hypothetical protein
VRVAECRAVPPLGQFWLIRFERLAGVDGRAVSAALRG